MCPCLLHWKQYTFFLRWTLKWFFSATIKTMLNLRIFICPTSLCLLFPRIVQSNLICALFLSLTLMYLNSPLIDWNIVLVLHKIVLFTSSTMPSITVYTVYTVWNTWKFPYLSAMQFLTFYNNTDASRPVSSFFFITSCGSHDYLFWEQIPISMRPWCPSMFFRVLHGLRKGALIQSIAVSHISSTAQQSCPHTCCILILIAETLPVISNITLKLFS